MERIIISFVVFCTFISGCTLPPVNCILEQMSIGKTYRFNRSKEILKDIIYDAYTYDLSLLRLNLGATTVTEKSVDEKYRVSLDTYMFRKDFHELSDEIRLKMPGTLNLRIGKFHGRKAYELLLIVSGDEDTSSILVSQMDYIQVKECPDDREIVQKGLDKLVSLIDL